MLSPNSSRSALSFPFGVESSKYKRRVGIASNLIAKIYDVCVRSSGKRKGIWRKFIYIRDINSFERNRARWSEIWARTVWPTCFKIINFSRKSSFDWNYFLLSTIRWSLSRTSSPYQCDVLIPHSISSFPYSPKKVSIGGVYPFTHPPYVYVTSRFPSPFPRQTNE